MNDKHLTFSSFLNKECQSIDLRGFFDCAVVFLKLNFPAAEISLIEHDYIPECYKLRHKTDYSDKHFEQLLSLDKKDVIKKDYYFEFNDLIILPVTDQNDKVNYFFLISPAVMVDRDLLGKVGSDINEICRIILAQIEGRSASIMENTANMVSQIAHDLNSLVSLIPEQIAEDEAVALRMKYSERLTKEITYYLRELQVAVTNVPLGELLNGIVAGLKIPENVQFDLNLTEEFDFIAVDVELIDRAITAVLENALFACKINGGKIVMTVKRRKNISLFMKSEWLEISISDTGPGIPVEFLDRVKKPFFTSWKEQGHVGLGLSNAEKIIKAHAGHLCIESIPGEKTEVTISLPLIFRNNDEKK
jgi:signal transduction histidine kinase